MRNVKPADWAYLLVSFMLSLYLLERQYEDNSISDARIKAYRWLIRLCRNINIAMMEVELRATKRINEELEWRL